MTVWVEIDICDGCGKCLRSCPYDAMELKDGGVQILDRCTNCNACLSACKNGALQSDHTPREIPDFKDHRGIWIFAEQREGKLQPVAFELLGKAADLAQTRQQDVSAVLLGDGVAALTDELFAYGADKIYLVEHTELKQYRTNAYAEVIADMIRKEKPEIFLMGATHIGRDLAPRISRKVGAGLTADCTELIIDPQEGILLQTRPAFGGNIMATIANRYSRPQMATVRPGVMEARRISGKRGDVVPIGPDMTNIETGIQILEIIKEDKKRVDLHKARVVVAGGRGVGNAEGFDILRQLAAAMGGEVAGTRVAVEEGWIPAENQVGQTGQTVRPDLYIACGISGAIQHRAGMMHSKYILAVNKDPGAPIFQIADWKIVGDLHDVIPEMINQMTASGSNIGS
jgi:electron transfer flavoprotein alpha subunit